MADIEEGKTDSEMEASLPDEAQRRRISFIDYVPPPPRPIPPPAKYKLWMIVLPFVFFADWFSYEADFLGWIKRTFHLSQNGGLFVLLATVVATLVFAALDLIVSCSWVRINGEWYGLETWLTQPRTKWVHEYNNFVVQLIACVVVIFEDGFSMFNAPKPAKQADPKCFFDSDADEDVVLKIEHRIRPDRITQFQAWREKIVKIGCHTRPGLKSVSFEGDPAGDHPVTYLTFASVDHLNEYMTSPVRARLVKKLQPLLQSPSIVQLQKNRNLPDAFTDLCARQGHSVPVRVPKKWKVWWVTTVGLWFVVLITNETLPFYFTEWHLDDAHLRSQSFVRAIFNTFLNTYVMTPFLTMIFGDWLKREEEHDEKREPWRTLNDGITSNWIKVLFFLAFYGGCAIAWATKESG